jgi:hypothetical protein
MPSEDWKIVEAAKEVVSSYRKWQGSMKTIRDVHTNAHEILLKHGEEEGNNVIGSTAVDSIQAREEFFSAVRSLSKVIP